MYRILRHLFFLLLVRPLVLIGLGVNVRHRKRLPDRGPAIIIANHNSHLDTLVLITLFPRRLLLRLHPVAAAGYFLKNRLLAWFALNIIGIIPLSRSVNPGEKDPLAGVAAALERGDILLFYPEGTRGIPERLQAFKTGLAHIAKRHPTVPIVPVFLHGLGKSLPKGEALLVPFFCDVFVGEPVHWLGDRKLFMDTVNTRMEELAREGNFPAWE